MLAESLLLKFEQFQTTFPIATDSLGLIVIQNKSIYARCVSGLLSGKEDNEHAPYRFVNQTGKRFPRIVPMVINTLPAWPLDDTKIVNALAKRVVADLTEAPYEGELQSLMNGITRNETIRLYGNYEFVVSSPMETLIKSMKLRPQRESQSILDNGRAFLDLLADIRLKQPVFILNLFSFLTESDIGKLAERAFFYEVPLVLLESTDYDIISTPVRKMTVDLDLCEFLSDCAIKTNHSPHGKSNYLTSESLRF